MFQTGIAMNKIKLETHRDLNIAGLNRRRVDVWLPEAYHINPNDSFPVLYIQDGQTVFDNWRKGTGGWEIHQAISRLAEEERIYPPIVVAISSTLNRAGDYLPAKALGNTSVSKASEESNLIEKTSTINLLSDLYLEWMVGTLKPVIDDRYRTLNDTQNTALMGSSLGGLISLYAICEYPEVFGKAACLSTHWPAVGDGMLTYLEGHLPQPGRHKFYFDHGSEGLDGDYEAWQSKVDALLRQKGYREGKDFASWSFPGEDHTTIAWRHRVHIPLTFLFETMDR
jgi:enterochelin esterase-like enzyme